MKQMHAERRKT